MPKVAVVSFLLWGVWLVVGVVQFFRHRTPTRVHPAANRRSGEAPLEAARACGADVSKGWKLGAPFELSLEGRTFRLVALTMTKGGPTVLALGTDVTQGRGSAFRSRPGPSATLPDLPQLVLRPENEHDRLGKRLRLNAELQTGDASFDGLVYIESNQRTLAETLLSLPEVRRGALAAMSPETSVVLNDELLPLALRWHVSDAPATPNELRASMMALGALADVFPAFERVELIRPSPGKRLAVGMGIFLGLVGLIVALPQVYRAYQPLGGAFQLVANVAVGPALVVGLIGSWIVSRGRVRGLARFYWLVALTLLAVPLVVPSVLASVNAVGISEVRTVQTTVVSANQTKNKNSTTCSAHLAPWPGEPRPVETRISCAHYEAAQKKPPALARLGQGRLGWEWVDDVDFLPPAHR